MSTPAIRRSPRQWGVLVLIGLLGGFLPGALGIGGGIVTVPLLVWFTGMDQRRAAATSLAAIVPTVVLGSIGYLSHQRVDVVAALALAVGIVPGVLFGTRLLRVLSLHVLRWGFIVLLIVVALRLLLVEIEPGGRLPLNLSLAALLVLVGLLSGMASGLFGIGGGTIMVPVLIAGFGAGDLIAKGTSLVAMIASSTVGTVANTRVRLVDRPAALVVGAAGLVATYLGFLAALAMPQRVTIVLFAVVLLGTAAQLVVRTLQLQRAAQMVPA